MISTVGFFGADAPNVSTKDQQALTNFFYKSLNVDRRMGASSMRAAAQWQWGDAENAIKA